MRARRALVTGASSGIGLATAKLLAENKINLLLVARRSERLEKLRAEWRAAFKVDVEFVATDLRESHAIETIKAHPKFSEVDLLINNAGLALGTAKIQDADPQDWQAMIDTNVTALLRLTRAVLPQMIANKSGHVVNVGSVAGRWVYPGGAVYCATKFAVRAISEGLRMDLIGTPLRVTNIEPGMVETEFSEVRMGDKERASAVYKGMKALSADDIAECIFWTLSRPAHVNIQEMVIFPTDQAAIQQVHRR